MVRIGSFAAVVASSLTLATFQPPHAGQAAQARRPAPPLELEAPITRSVSGPTSLTALVALRPGESVRVELSVDGARARATVKGRSGRVVAETGDLTRVATESLLIVGEVAGTATVEVSADAMGSTPGTLTVTLTERRARTATDAALLSAQQAYAQGWRSLNARPADTATARTRFEAAARLAEPSGDARLGALIARGLSETHDRAGNLDGAHAEARRAQTLFEQAGDARAAAWTLTMRARLQYEAAPQEESAALSAEAAERWRALGDRRGEAAAETIRGVYADFAGNPSDAMARLQQAVSLASAAGDYEIQARALQQFGNHLTRSGEPQQALDRFSEALPLMRRAGGARLEASIRNDLGTLYNVLGEYERARDEFERVVRQATLAGDAVARAHGLMNAGTNEADLDRPLEAKTRLELARAAMQRLNDTGGEAIVMNNLASIEGDLGRSSDALASLLQAHRLFVALGHKQGERITLTSLGLLHCEGRRFAEGGARLDDAVRLSREASDRAQEALALAFRATCAADDNRLDDAHRDADDAHAIVERIRAELVRDDLRASFFSTARPILARKVDVLVRLHERQPDRGWEAAAFAVSEQARARSMLELLPALNGVVRARPPASVADEREALAASLREARDGSAEAGDLLAAYHELQAKIRRLDPRYAELTDPATLSLPQAQALIPSGAVVIEYLLARSGSHVWALTNGGVFHATLPRRQDIEAVARRMLRALRGRETERDPQRQAALDAAYWREASALSHLIVTPIERQLEGRKIYVVPDGVLHVVPFAALPHTPGRSAARTPLLATNEVATLPSLSVLGLLRERAAPPLRRDTPIAVVADPIYDAGDLRLPRSPGTDRPGAAPAARPAPVALRATSSTGTFDRLLGSGREAAEIKRIAPRDTVTVFEGAEATRALMVGGVLERFPLVHIATHGVLDNRRPEYSGLVMSLYDRQRRPVDGYLRLIDVYELSLSANLVVLSACESARGRETDGEGVIGLTRGFLLAGASRVISSQWKIRDDESTPQFMAWFYDALLRRSLSPSAALRDAQLRMWKSRDWSAPYFWAAFTLYGE
jgi:CHAT domain-containing protein/tetratricopeptide (TPR) repeat protein